MNNALRKQQGFTLVELIIVIILLGIVGAGASQFMRTTSLIYLDVTEREALLRDASFAAERIARELSRAVPNSVRVDGNASVHCVEFVPINWNAYYLSVPLVADTATEADVVELSDIDGNFYVPDGNDFAIVYPLESDHVYDASNDRRQAIDSCSDDDGNCSTADADSIVQLDLDDGFAELSPNNRLYIADSSVSYCVRGSALYRHESTISTSQSLYTSGGDLMAQNLTNTLSADPANSPSIGDPFRAIDASLTRNGFTRVNFLFTRNDEEQISVLREVQVANVP